MIFILFLIFIIFLIWLEYKRTKLLFNYLTLFLIYWYLYTIGIFFSGEQITYYNILATKLILLGGFSFIMGYYFIPLGTKKFVQVKKDYFYNIPDMRIFVFILSVIAIVLFVYVVFIKIGFKEYFFTTRAHRSLIVRPYSKFMIFIDLFNIISALSLFLYIKTKRKFYKIIFIIIFSIAFLHAILTISRNNLVLLIFPIIYILHYFNYLKTRTIVILLFLGIFIAASWKIILGSILLYDDFNVEVLKHLKFPREFIVWQEIANNILPQDINLNGKSYFKAFTNFIYPHHVTNLSLWYVQNFEPNVFEIGGGRGFSNVLEAYLSFGIIGVILIFFFLGILIYIFQLKSRNNIVLFLSYAFSLSFIHRIFRADFLSFTKTWWWMYFISLVLLFFVFNILKRVSNASKLYNQSKI